MANYQKRKTSNERLHYNTVYSMNKRKKATERYENAGTSADYGDMRPVAWSPGSTIKTRLRAAAEVWHADKTAENSKAMDVVVREAIIGNWSNTEIARQIMCTAGNTLPRYRRIKAVIASEVDKSQSVEDSEL